MTRQTRDPNEINDVNRDTGRFNLPFTASLDLGGEVVYGVTDTSVALSMVNVRHLNNTRDFRGMWSPNPSDGGTSVPYRPGQVVIGSPSDPLLYALNDSGDGSSAPSSTSTSWTRVGGVALTVQSETNAVTNGTNLNTLNFGNGFTVAATTDGVATITPEDLVLAGSTTASGDNRADITLTQMGAGTGNKSVTIAGGTGITVARADNVITITSAVEDILGARPFSAESAYPVGSLVYDMDGRLYAANTAHATGSTPPTPTSTGWDAVGGAGLTVNTDTNIDTINFNNGLNQVTDTTDSSIKNVEVDAADASLTVAEAGVSVNLSAAPNDLSLETDGLQVDPYTAGDNIAIANNVVTGDAVSLSGADAASNNKTLTLTQGDATMGTTDNVRGTITVQGRGGTTVTGTGDTLTISSNALSAAAQEPLHIETDATNNTQTIELDHDASLDLKTDAAVNDGRMSLSVNLAETNPGLEQVTGGLNVNLAAAPGDLTLGTDGLASTAYTAGDNIAIANNVVTGDDVAFAGADATTNSKVLNVTQGTDNVGAVTVTGAGGTTVSGAGDSLVITSRTTAAAAAEPIHILSDGTTDTIVLDHDDTLELVSQVVQDPDNADGTTPPARNAQALSVNLNTTNSGLMKTAGATGGIAVDLQDTPGDLLLDNTGLATNTYVGGDFIDVSAAANNQKTISGTAVELAAAATTGGAQITKTQGTNVDSVALLGGDNTTVTVGTGATANQITIAGDDVDATVQAIASDTNSANLRISQGTDNTDITFSGAGGTTVQRESATEFTITSRTTAAAAAEPIHILSDGTTDTIILDHDNSLELLAQAVQDPDLADGTTPPPRQAQVLSVNTDDTTILKDSSGNLGVRRATIPNRPNDVQIAGENQQVGIQVDRYDLAGADAANNSKAVNLTQNNVNRGTLTVGRDGPITIAGTGDTLTVGLSIDEDTLSVTGNELSVDTTTLASGATTALSLTGSNGAGTVTLAQGAAAIATGGTTVRSSAANTITIESPEVASWARDDTTGTIPAAKLPTGLEPEVHTYVSQADWLANINADGATGQTTPQIALRPGDIAIIINPSDATENGTYIYAGMTQATAAATTMEDWRRVATGSETVITYLQSAGATAANWNNLFYDSDANAISVRMGNMGAGETVIQMLENTDPASTNRFFRRIRIGNQVYEFGDTPTAPPITNPPTRTVNAFQASTSAVTYSFDPNIPAGHTVVANSYSLGTVTNGAFTTFNPLPMVNAGTGRLTVGVTGSQIPTTATFVVNFRITNDITTQVFDVSYTATLRAVDSRAQPRITGTATPRSILDARTTDFAVVLLGGGNLSQGTAFDVDGFTATGTDVVSNSPTGFTIQPALESRTAQIAWTVPDPRINRQGESQVGPNPRSFTVNRYTPWYFGVGTTTPTSIAGLTPVTSDIAGRTITVRGMVNDRVYIVAGTDAVNNRTLNLALPQSNLDGAALGTFNQVNATNGMTEFTVYGFGTLINTDSTNFTFTIQ